MHPMLLAKFACCCSPCDCPATAVTIGVSISFTVYADCGDGCGEPSYSGSLTLAVSSFVLELIPESCCYVGCSDWTVGTMSRCDGGEGEYAESISARLRVCGSLCKAPPGAGGLWGVELWIEGQWTTSFYPDSWVDIPGCFLEFGHIPQWNCAYREDVAWGGGTCPDDSHPWGQIAGGGCVDWPPDPGFPQACATPSPDGTFDWPSTVTVT